MDASSVIRHLLETPDDDPLDIGPLDRYTGPVEFNNSVKDIIDHARMLKQQAEQAGALAALQHINSSGRPPLPVDVDRAFLMLAVEQYADEFKQPARYARWLKREMHSIWD